MPKGVHRKSAFYGGLAVDPWQIPAFLPVLPGGSTTGVQPDGVFLSTPLADDLQYSSPEMEEKATLLVTDSFPVFFATAR